MFAGGGELRGGRAFAAGRAAYRHAAHSGKNLEADSRRSGMIANPFTYHIPATLDEAFPMIEEGGKLLAGGMSLIPLMKLRLASPESVIDLRRIPGLNEISESGGVVR